MSFSPREIWKEFAGSRIALVGMGIIAALVCMSIIAFVAIPVQTFREWNDPSSWLAYPKSAMPAWINYFLEDKIPEHMILKPQQASQESGGMSVVEDVFATDYQYGSFPSDFIYQFAAKYRGSPLVQLSVTRPDGITSVLMSSSLPYSTGNTAFEGMMFSSDTSVKKNLQNSIQFRFPTDSVPSQDLVFSQSGQNSVLKGLYVFKVTAYDTSGNISLERSSFIVGGKVYGIMGTDE